MSLSSSSHDNAITTTAPIIATPEDSPLPVLLDSTTTTSFDSFATNFQVACRYLQDCRTSTVAPTESSSSTSSHDAVTAAASVPPASVLPDFLSQVTVSFIDPTTSSIMMSSSGSSAGGSGTTSTSSSSSSSKPSSVGYSAAVKKAKLNQSIQLYEKFQRIFASHYQNCLSNVPYQLFRNTMMTGEISVLPIRTVVTRGHGGFIVMDDTTTTTTTTGHSQRWSQTGRNQQKIYGNFSWDQPYCYVYLAACESLDHYRTKVKPSIQVFISQLDAAIKASHASSTSSSALGRFRRSRSNPSSDSTTTTTMAAVQLSQNTINSNDTSMDDSINGGGGAALDVSTNNTHSKSKKNKRIPPAPRYVIIYVPTGHTADHPIHESMPYLKPGTSSSSSSSSTGGGSSTTTAATTATTASTTTTTSAIGASVVSRLAAARQRMTSAVGRTTTTTNNSNESTTTTTTTTMLDMTTSGTDDNMSTTTTTTTTTTDVNHTMADDELLGPSNLPSQQQQQQPSAPIQQLNRMEREIARRFVIDFPAGNVCTLSTLFDAPSMSPTEDGESHPDGTAATTPRVSDNVVQQLEWQAVLKAMGNAIMASFHDRCQRYDDEIRLIDQKRRGAVSESSPSTPTKLPPSDGLDESTSGIPSSTVDDLHLCHFFLLKENLAFTYEQMRLPSEAMLQYDELRAFLPDRNETTPVVETLSSMITALNDHNNDDDTKHLNGQEMIDLALRGNILEFRRLLKMHGDVATIQQVANEYLFMREIALLFQMQQPVRIMRRCYSYIQSSFEVKKRQIDEMDISKEFRLKLVELYQWAFCYCWYIKSGSDCLFADGSVAKSSDYSACARCVCDILEFARNCFECLGDLILSQSDVPLRPYGQGFAKTLQNPWTPWHAPNVADLPNQKLPVRFATPQEFLNNALTSRDTFTDRYCDMLDTIATCHEYCGRRRYAARLRMERVDILDVKGYTINAAKEILSIVTLYRSDQWNACYFALMLRLAGFQRITVTPSEYLDTLVRCFYRGVHDVAPPKALGALHTDLMSVIDHESVKGIRYTAASIFGPSFGLEDMAPSVLPGSDRSLLKKLYTLGDTIRVRLALNCYLFQNIEVDSISINLVPFPKYVAAVEDNVLITQDDIHHAIKFYKVALSSGTNEIKGEWQPISSGQFIIASVCILWSGVEFTYTAKEIRRPTIRIDVVGCTPSHTLDVTPKFLLVGQEQPIKVDLNANKDCIIQGTLLVEGPSNASFRIQDSGHNDTREWVPSLEIAANACSPNQTVSNTVYVKIASTIEPSKQFVRVNLSTTYKHANMDVDDAMQASIDAAIDILDRSAFSVCSCDLISYSSDKVVINAVVECNCPTNLTLKGWSIDVPSCYILSTEGDLNDSLANETICCGDRLSLTFDCTYVSNAPTSGSTLNSNLHIKFENEMGAQLQESIQLRMKPPIGVAKVLDTIPSSVKILTSMKESMVGLPVEITYTIELSELNLPNETLSYEIDTDHADWIVNGKTIGLLDATPSKPLDVTIIAIPIRPGSIQEYPSLTLSYLSDHGTTTLPISITATEPFTSLSPSVHKSVAFLVGRTSEQLQ